MKCDLHTHSVHSDGSFTTAELVAQGKENNLVIALTDHNTVSGLADFMRQGAEMGVITIPGTELSCAHGKNEFHLLGLFIKPQYYDRVERLVKEIHVLKEISNIEMVERLNEGGYMINYADVKKRNVNGNANRAHVAAELVDKGYFETVSEVFDTILAEDKGFYVQPERLQLLDAIKFLREIEALPVLAHPLKDVEPQVLISILPELIEAGLCGIETMHSSYSNEQIERSKEIAKEFNLLESGGSDFHGKVKPGIDLGVGKGNLNVPLEIYHKLQEKHISLYPEK